MLKKTKMVVCVPCSKTKIWMNDVCFLVGAGNSDNVLGWIVVDPTRFEIRWEC